MGKRRGKEKGRKGRGRNRSGIKKPNMKVKKGFKKSGGRRGGEGKRKRNRKVQKNGKMGIRQRGNPRQHWRQETFCPVEIATALKLKYNQVRNFKKQLKRAQNHAKIISRKKGKKGDFATVAEIVSSSVGGNLSKPSCQSDSVTDASSTGMTLQNCSTSIESDCGDISVDESLTGECSDTMTAFETKITECEGSGSCTCWTEAVAMKPDIQKCSAKDEADRVKAAKNTCLAAFGACKKAQDSAVQIPASCPKPQTGMTTTAKPGRRGRMLADIMAKSLFHRSRSVL